MTKEFDAAVALLHEVRAYGNRGIGEEFTEEGYAAVADPFDQALLALGYDPKADLEEGAFFEAHLTIGYSGGRGSDEELLATILKQ